MDIAKIDKNFKIETSIKKHGIRFFNIDNPPFHIYGVFKENGFYRRMPQKIAEKVGEGVLALHTNTSGGRIRFITDSPYIAISVKMGNICRMSHFTLVGSAGFDMYVREDCKEIYSGSFIPPYDMKDGYEQIIEFKNDIYAEPKSKLREITINMPTYSDVKEVYIGLDENSVVKEPSAYVNEKPIVYYGHSITQGGCVTRPGYTYPNILSRRLNCDFINLGFSGNALGQKEMADYIAGLDMKMFIYDYDNNAPNADFLRNTHEVMFKIIRKSHPHIPIIILTATTRRQYLGSKEERLSIVYKTYQNALKNGDKNVYLLDASKVCDNIDGYVGATVEGTHLNDIGFQNLAEALEKVIKPLI